MLILIRFAQPSRHFARVESLCAAFMLILFAQPAGVRSLSLWRGAAFDIVRTSTSLIACGTMVTCDPIIRSPATRSL